MCALCSVLDNVVECGYDYAMLGFTGFKRCASDNTKRFRNTFIVWGGILYCNMIFIEKGNIFYNFF